MEYQGRPHAVQLQGASRRRAGSEVIWTRNQREICSGIERQYNYSCLYQPPVQSQSGARGTRSENLARSSYMGHTSTGKIPRWKTELARRHVKPKFVTLRMEIEPNSVPISRLNVGASHCGPFRLYDDDPTPTLQQSVFRPPLLRYRCIGPKLDRGKQLRQSTLLVDPENSKFDCLSKSRGDHYSPLLACATLVQAVGANVHSPPAQDTKQPPVNLATRYLSRTTQEQKMEVVRLEDYWRLKLGAQGWSDRAKCQFPCNWAKSTLDLYNRLLDKLKSFCMQFNVVFPPRESKHIADFLCVLADSSSRPRSQLCSASAAISSLYEALDYDNVMHRPEIRKLCTALIKSGTQVPRNRTALLPVEPFKELFLSWEDNDKLTIKELRLKCLTLLAFAMFLRPSDVAPNARVFDKDTHVTDKFIMSVDQVTFNEDGSMTVMFFGIKNDYYREGFSVHVQPCSVSKLDPVCALRCYIRKTSQNRQTVNGPLFISLNKPHHALSSASIGKILEEAINLAGLGGRGFSAKCFRPTGATAAIEAKIVPDSVRKVGRWKSQEVFEQHYVHAKSSSDFTDKVFNM